MSKIGYVRSNFLRSLREHELSSLTELSATNLHSIVFIMHVPFLSVVVAWSIEFLPTNSAAGVRFPTESGIFFRYPSTGFMPFVFCPIIFGGGPGIPLTTDSGTPIIMLLSSVLVYNLVSPAGVWPTDIWIVLPWEGKSYIEKGK